jgi:hypothetical protein
MGKVPGFASLCRRHGVVAILPCGDLAYGLYDAATKAEDIKNYESQILAGTHSIVLEDSLTIGQKITIGGEAFEIRDIETDPDGALTRYFLMRPAREAGD